VSEPTYHLAPSRWSRLAWKVSHWSWWYTMPVAFSLWKWTRWAQAPNNRPFLWARFVAGISVACWTHVCGHGIIYSLRMGNLCWSPRRIQSALARWKKDPASMPGGEQA